MAVAECLWCEAEVKAHRSICPECGLHNPAGKVHTASKVVRRGRRVLLALFAVPLMLSAAYAAHVGVLPLGSVPAGGSAVASPAGVQLADSATVPMPALASPLQQAVWADGVKAVRLALGQPGYVGFQSSFVSVATGNIVSLCGRIPGTSGYASETGEQRFISVFGQAAATTLEGNDPSFGVLWNRVCAGGTSQA
jgi:hypothetical protein